jgi:hypothetical protein
VVYRSLHASAVSVAEATPGQARVGGPQSKKPTIMEGGMGAKEEEADNRGLGGVRGKILGGMDGIVTAQKAVMKCRQILLCSNGAD